MTGAFPPPAEDEAVPAFWRRLGLPGLADVHTHFMPPRLLAKVWAYFDAAGPLVGTEWPIRYRWDDDTRVAYLGRLGVRTFTALAYPHRPGMAESLNRWTLDFAARTPGCLPSATFFPEPDAARYVAHALTAGARVFKVHVQVGGFRPTDPALDAVWGLLADAGVPVVVHAGHAPVGTAHTGPEPFAALLARHPRLATVVAHLGAPDYAAFLDLADRYAGVRLDTTMAFTSFFDRFVPFPPTERPRLRELGLAGKVLLGSDYPNIPYPYAEQLDGLARLELGDDWLRAVCWDNADALFDLA
ncbi:amidohydrolase family protein [Micromonospora maritima]|uniref:amidohydrolase family protein n=1 Tax=Micromonospora maritima TaxID=986711 RepID=UPI00157D41E0|nr:amidohydrolase family protein [Micromonospora maritima]